jgi:two-component system chemotaxis response regulator CheB
MIVLAASAGGLSAINKILSSLPKDFAAPIAIVQHLSPNYPSVIVEILSMRTLLHVKQAEIGDLFSPGCVYIAPPDQHLLIDDDGVLSLSHGEKVCNVRPSANILFKSVAKFQDRVIAVVLTGMDSDGATGVQAIKQMGGTVIAQDEATSKYFGMPNAAIKTGDVDFILPLDAIANKLLDLIKK